MVVVQLCTKLCWTLSVAIVMSARQNRNKVQKDAGPILWSLCIRTVRKSLLLTSYQDFELANKTWHTACCVVCDRFSRMIYVLLCRDYCNTKEAVQLIIRMVIAPYSCPRVIISDWGTQFDSELWRDLWTSLGTQVNMATTRHPQTNRLIERINRTLISLICKYTQQAGSQWAELLPLFEFVYNRSKHEQTNMTPFSVVYGHDPPIPTDLFIGMEAPMLCSHDESYVADKLARLQFI